MTDKTLQSDDKHEVASLLYSFLPLLFLMGWSLSVFGASCALELNGDATIKLFPDRCFGWDRAVWESLVLSYTGEPAWDVEGEGIWDDDGVSVPLSTTDDLRRLAVGLSHGDLAAQVRSAAEAYDAGASQLVLLAPPISIDAVEDLLEDVEAALDELLDRVEESTPGGDREAVAHLYECAGRMEDVVDGLEYVASRIRLYAHAEVQAELAEWVREVALCAAEGDRSRYVRSIHALLERVLALQGCQIHTDAASAIRSRGDRLLRLCDDRTTGRSLDLDVSTTLFEVGIDASWGIEATDSLAPSRWRVTNEAGIAVETELEGFAIDLVVQGTDTDYLDSIKDAGDAEVRKAEVQVESESEGRGVRVGVEVSRKRSPGNVDRQFAAGSETVVRSNMGRLRVEIGNAGIPGEVTAELIGLVEGAVQALNRGALEGAVDWMEDFIDEVNDLVWEGSLLPSTGDRLVAAAREILPKRIEREWTVPASVAFDAGTVGCLDLDVSIGRRRVPTNPRLARLREKGSLDWQTEIGQAELEAGFEVERTEYPNDSSKTKRESQTSYAIESVQAGWTVEFESSSRSTAYPQAATKDQLQSEGALCLSCDADWITASLELGRSVVRYPNDRSRAMTDRRDREFEADCTVGAVAFDLSASCTRHVDEAGSELRVQRITSLAADWSPSDSLRLGTALEWQRSIEWDSPEGDSSSLSFSLSFDWSL
jgi:hypothetical protein